MSDFKLSTEEISALFNHVDNLNEEEMLSEAGVQILTEMFGIAYGSTTKPLHSLLSKEISIQSPELSLTDKEALIEGLTRPHILVTQNYTGQIKGKNLLIFPQDEIFRLLHITSLEEFKRIIFTMDEGLNRSLSTLADDSLGIISEGIEKVDPKSVKEHIEKDIYIKAEYPIKIGEKASKMIQLSPLKVAKAVSQIFLNQYAGTQPNKQAKQEEHAMESKTASNEAYQSIRPVQFSNFEQKGHLEMENRNLDILMDVTLQVTVELGRTKKLVKEILELTQGSIIELDKVAGEPVDILINQKLIAKGEIVVIDENFGVRITAIISPLDRLSKLK